MTLICLEQTFLNHFGARVTLGQNKEVWMGVDNPTTQQPYYDYEVGIQTVDHFVD